MSVAQGQVERCIGLLAAGGPATSDVPSLFAQNALGGMPAAVFAEMLRRELPVADAAPVSVAVRGDYDVVVVVRMANGGTSRFAVRTEDEPPYRITGFDVGAAPAGDARRLPWEGLTAAAPGPTTHSELPGDLSGQLDLLVAAHREQHRTPGLLAVVADEDARLLWWRAEGVASLLGARAPSPGMTVRIGSVSKTMTALAVMQLVETERVDLDAPAASYLTSVRLAGPHGADITVRHLLTHTSGLRPRAGVDNGVDRDQLTPSVRDFFAGGVSGDTTPGQEWAYSNDGFALLGQLVEDVTEQPFSDYANDRVFDPLGMTGSSFRRDQRVRGALFEGIDVELDEAVEAPYRHIIPLGAGSVFSTPEDMARYGAAMLGLGENAHGRALTAASFAQMVQRQDVPAPAPGLRMGLGWVLSDSDGPQFYWHNGGWAGANSEIAVLPQQRRTVLVFGNTVTDGLDALCIALVAEIAHSTVC